MNETIIIACYIHSLLWLNIEFLVLDLLDSLLDDGKDILEDLAALSCRFKSLDFAVQLGHRHDLAKRGLLRLVVGHLRDKVSP